MLPIDRVTVVLETLISGHNPNNRSRILLRFPQTQTIERAALLLIIILFFFSFPAAIAGQASAAAAETPGPAETAVRQMLATISKLHTTKDSVERTQLVARINDSLALDSLSKDALGAQWSKLDRAERASFASLLRELLQKLAYPEASVFFTGLDVQFGREQTKGAQRIVPTTVKRSEGGAVSIDYVLARSGSKWRVVDIILDGQSLAANVTAQIQAVLKQGSYDSLMAQMAAKLKQPDS
jgi:phospholipid transport system substrate-binding protein